MPRKRKTIAVDSVRDMANKMLRDSRDDQKGGRLGIASILEKVLMETGNYHGFGYIDGARGEADDTRRQYY